MIGTRPPGMSSSPPADQTKPEQAQQTQQAQSGNGTAPSQPQRPKPGRMPLFRK